MGRRRIKPIAAGFGALLLILIGAPTVAAQAGEVGVITYAVDIDTASVGVSENLSIGAGSDTVSTYVPVEAVELTSSAALVRDSFDDYFDLVTLRTSETTATLEYRLTSTDRGEEGARVNGSFVGFAILPSPQADTVVVTLPPGYRADEDPALFDAREVDKDTYEYASEFADELWGYWFIALADDGLDTRIVDAGEDAIEVVAWAGDTEWLDFTERYVREGVPVLRELIGEPWPEDDLRIVEGIEPTKFGYAGWYSRRESQIEIPDSVDSETLLHELSHAWFNDRFYSGRWLVEGFAEEMASSALERLDGQITDPDPPGTPPSGFDGLARWRSRFFFEDTWELEYFGYDTSWYVIDALSDEIGTEAMTTVIGAMQDGRAVYGLDGEPVLYPANDWRRFLDVLELRGGSEEATELFRAWVVPSDELVLLDRRVAAMTVFDTFAGDDLATVPFGIRDAMSRWNFDEALSQIARAELIRADIADLSDRADRQDLRLPTVIDDLYRSSGPDFSLIRRVVDRTDTLLTVFELSPEELDDANRRNFEAGRYERIDADLSLADPGSTSMLNQNRRSTAVPYLYLGSLGALVIMIAGIWLLYGRLKSGVPYPTEPATDPDEDDMEADPQPPPPRPHATSSTH